MELIYRVLNHFNNFGQSGVAVASEIRRASRLSEFQKVHIEVLGQKDYIKLIPVL